MSHSQKQKKSGICLKSNKILELPLNGIKSEEVVFKLVFKSTSKKSTSLHVPPSPDKVVGSPIWLAFQPACSLLASSSCFFLRACCCWLVRLFACCGSVAVVLQNPEDKNRQKTLRKKTETRSCYYDSLSAFYNDISVFYDIFEGKFKMIFTLIVKG